MGGLRFMDKSTAGQARKPGNRIKVIGAGLPRCATSSLQAALESPILGFSPCMHMSTVMPHAEHLQTMIDIMVEKDREKRQAMIYKLFEGYESTSDFPGAWFVVDLMDMYPDAVIVLNQRPGGSKKWLPNIRGAFAFFRTWKYRIGCFPILTDRLTYKLHGIFWKDLASHHEGRHMPLEEYYDYYQDLVIREAKKRGRRLLVWNASDGWEPLCEFLGKEVPGEDVPFPHVNDQETFRFMTRMLLTRGLVTWAVMGASVLAASTWGREAIVRISSAAHLWKSPFGFWF